jgi:ABC-type branched-subunit amino acid transport system substrate-binding protein
MKTITTHRRRGITRALLGLLLPASLLAASCGSDDEAADTSSTVVVATSPANAATTATDEPAATDAPGSTDAPATTDAAVPPSGDPIVVHSFIVVDTPSLTFIQTQNGAQAAVDGINARGGINGRPLEIVFCNGRLDPGEAANCATTAVDSEAVAVVASVEPLGGVVVPILEEAQMPHVGAAPVADVDSTSLISFPTDVGQFLHATGAAFFAENFDAKTIVLLQSEVPGREVRQALNEAQAAKLGMTVLKTVVIPANTADASPYLADAVAENPDALVTAITAGDAVKVFQAVESQGIDTPMVGGAAAWTPDIIAAGGAGAEGAFVNSHYPNPHSDLPGMQQYRDDMAEFAADAVVGDDSVRGWTGVMVFAAAAEVVDGEVTRESILDVLNSPDGLNDVLWYGDKLNWSEPGPFPEYPRLVVNVAYFNQVENGQTVAFGEPTTIE